MAGFTILAFCRGEIGKLLQEYVSIDFFIISVAHTDNDRETKGFSLAKLGCMAGFIIFV